MARPLRIQYEGALYHVMNRGINHQNIFLKNLHREFFLNLLEDISLKFHIEVHSFCLMDNHYHLLIRTPFPNLSKAMRHLDGVYTRRFNNDEGRDGSIFRGRYKAILIEEESYLLQVSRYIHLNPIEAGLCQNAIDYEWSSYSSFIDERKKQNWLKTDLILSYFNNKKSYIGFIDQGIDDSFKEKYSDSLCIFGSDEFIKKHISMVSEAQKKFCLPDIRKSAVLPTIQQISEAISTYYSMKIQNLRISKRSKLNLPRKIAIFISRRYGQYSHQEISDFFGGISSNSISTLIQRIEKTILSTQELQNHLDDLIKIIFDKSRNV